MKLEVKEFVPGGQSSSNSMMDPSSVNSFTPNTSAPAFTPGQGNFGG